MSENKRLVFTLKTISPKCTDGLTHSNHFWILVFDKYFFIKFFFEILLWFEVFIYLILSRFRMYCLLLLVQKYFQLSVWHLYIKIELNIYFFLFRKIAWRIKEPTQTFIKDKYFHSHIFGKKKKHKKANK